MIIISERDNKRTVLYSAAEIVGPYTHSASRRWRPISVHPPALPPPRPLLLTRPSQTPQTPTPMKTPTTPVPWLTTTCAHPSIHTLLPLPCCRALCAHFTPMHPRLAPDALHASACHHNIPARPNHPSFIHTSPDVPFPCVHLSALHVRITQSLLAAATRWLISSPITIHQSAACRSSSCRLSITPGLTPVRTTDCLLVS